MTNICPECGAQLTDFASCQEIFDEFLALEFTAPEYGAVHFLTVACFMVQHGRYSDAGLKWIKSQLKANLEDGVSAQQIRRQANQTVQNPQRDWKVTRSPADPPAPPIPWSMTIADVAAGYHDAPSYRRLITLWAETTLREMQT